MKKSSTIITITKGLATCQSKININSIIM